MRVRQLICPQELREEPRAGLKRLDFLPTHRAVHTHGQMSFEERGCEMTPLAAWCRNFCGTRERSCFVGCIYWSAGAPWANTGVRASPHVFDLEAADFLS